MKPFATLIAIAFASAALAATTVHRSFRNGYPATGGVSVRTAPNAAVLKAPKTARAKSTVVTNRVVLTKEQAEKLLKARERQRKR